MKAASVAARSGEAAANSGTGQAAHRNRSAHQLPFLVWKVMCVLSMLLVAASGWVSSFLFGGSGLLGGQVCINKGGGSARLTTT